MRSPPLRFLLAVLVLWVGVRAAILMPGGLSPAPAAAESAPAVTAIPHPGAAFGDIPPAEGAVPPGIGQPPAPANAQSLRSAPPALASDPPSPAAAVFPVAPPGSDPKAVLTPGPAPVALSGLSPRPSRSRWSASAWLLVRDEQGGAALAPGGTLGGSQAGARVAYALGGGLSLSARAYLPLRRTAGAELAAGIDWRPLPALSLNLLAERRQRLGREGRNAFALTLYGGASRNLAPGVRLDLYGQTGVVGLHARDRFADGSVRLSRRAGPVELGVGAWGAAQPGAARLDLGPSLSWHLPVPAANLRLQADWRFRIAGDAMPRSGPALTIATDF